MYKKNCANNFNSDLLIWHKLIMFMILTLVIFIDSVVYISLFLGPNVKTAVAILKCLLARQLCFEDASCSAILEIIPRVCGSELGE